LKLLALSSFNHTAGRRFLPFGITTISKWLGDYFESYDSRGFTMRHTTLVSTTIIPCLCATAFIAAPASATPVGVGQLQFGGTPIAMTSGSGVGNDGYYMNTTTGPGAKQLLIGIKAHEYRNGNNPAGTSTVSSLYGGGSWLNVNGTTGAYTGFTGVSTVDVPSWWAGLPANSAMKWGFTWSITLDGARPAAGAISMNMQITRPNGQVSTIVTSQDVGTDFSAGNMAWQQNWNVGYLAGCSGQANDVGDWKIKITAFSGETTYGQQEITVTANAIPAPGAAALIGLAGLVAGRRRRN
jgi:MYXO-CTERM domain-containing protein